MAFNLPGYNTGAGAPKVEDGLALARFEDLKMVAHPDWATKADKFGKPDDGNRFHFQFTMLDEDGAVVYPEGEVDPLELEATTRTATGEKSNFFAILSGLLNAPELAAYKAATADSPFDGSSLPGRIVHVKVAHSEKGWPYVEQVVGIAKVKAAK